MHGVILDEIVSKNDVPILIYCFDGRFYMTSVGLAVTAKHEIPQSVVSRSTANTGFASRTLFSSR